MALEIILMAFLDGFTGGFGASLPSSPTQVFADDNEQEEIVDENHPAEETS